MRQNETRGVDYPTNSCSITSWCATSRELLPLCADQGVGVLSYSPLGGGFLTGKYRPSSEIPGGTRMDGVPLMQSSYFHAAGFRIVEGLRSKAAALGTSISVLALARALPRL